MNSLPQAFEKKLRRLEKNRESARECRRRKKEHVVELQKQVALLEAENLKLKLQLKVGEESQAQERQEKGRITKKLDDMVRPAFCLNIGGKWVASQSVMSIKALCELCRLPVGRYSLVTSIIWPGSIASFLLSIAPHFFLSLQQVKTGASESDIWQTIDMLKERYSDYGSDRRSAIEFHTNQLEKVRAWWETRERGRKREQLFTCFVLF